MFNGSEFVFNMNTFKTTQPQHDYDHHFVLLRIELLFIVIVQLYNYIFLLSH